MTVTCISLSLSVSLSDYNKYVGDVHGMTEDTAAASHHQSIVRQFISNSLVDRTVVAY